MRKPPLLTMAMLITSSLLHWQLGDVSDEVNALLYSRQGILAGEIWRLFSGHLLHFSFSHLVWNLAAFGLLAGALEYRSGAAALGKLLVMLALVISTGLLVLAPDMAFYGGLSAINYGLAAQWLLSQNLAPLRLRVSSRLGMEELQTGHMLVALLIVHSLYQGWTGTSLLSDGFGDTEIEVAWLSHLLGISLVLKLWMQLRVRALVRRHDRSAGERLRIFCAWRQKPASPTDGPRAES